MANVFKRLIDRFRGKNKKETGKQLTQAAAKVKTFNGKNLTAAEQDEFDKEMSEILKEFKRIKTASREGKEYKHTFSGLKYIKQLNGKTLYSKSAQKEADNDLSHMDDLMALAQISGPLSATFSKLDKYLRPGKKQVFINKMKTDPQSAMELASELVGMCMVAEYIMAKNDNAAVKAFGEYQLTSAHLSMMQEFMNIVIPADMKERLLEMSQIMEKAVETGTAHEVAMALKVENSGVSSSLDIKDENPAEIAIATIESAAKTTVNLPSQGTKAAAIAAGTSLFDGLKDFNAPNPASPSKKSDPFVAKLLGDSLVADILANAPKKRQHQNTQWFGIASEEKKAEVRERFKLQEAYETAFVPQARAREESVKTKHKSWSSERVRQAAELETIREKEARIQELTKEIDKCHLGIDAKEKELLAATDEETKIRLTAEIAEMRETYVSLQSEQGKLRIEISQAKGSQYAEVEGRKFSRDAIEISSYYENNPQIIEGLKEQIDLLIQKLHELKEKIEILEQEGKTEEAATVRAEFDATGKGLEEATRKYQEISSKILPPEMKEKIKEAFSVKGSSEEASVDTFREAFRAKIERIQKAAENGSVESGTLEITADMVEQAKEWHDTGLINMLKGVDKKIAGITQDTSEAELDKIIGKLTKVSDMRAMSEESKAQVQTTLDGLNALKEKIQNNSSLSPEKKNELLEKIKAYEEMVASTTTKEITGMDIVRALCQDKKAMKMITEREGSGLLSIAIEGIEKLNEGRTASKQVAKEGEPLAVETAKEIVDGVAPQADETEKSVDSPIEESSLEENAPSEPTGSDGLLAEYEEGMPENAEVKGINKEALAAEQEALDREAEAMMEQMLALERESTDGDVPN